MLNLVIIPSGILIVDHACETMHIACETGALMRKFEFRAFTSSIYLESMAQYAARTVSQMDMVGWLFVTFRQLTIVISLSVWTKRLYKYMHSWYKPRLELASLVSS
jgi:hypothetical protein